jgi:hypothetical protein
MTDTPQATPAGWNLVPIDRLPDGTDIWLWEFERFAPTVADVQAAMRELCGREDAPHKNVRMALAKCRDYLRVAGTA